MPQKYFGKVHSKYKTPANALMLNAFIGIIALLSGKTGEIITIACFGALTLYIISMISLFRLRKNEPEMERPFKVPLYPIFPAIALVLSIVALLALIVYNQGVFIVYVAIIAASYAWFMFTGKHKTAEN